MSVSSEKGKSLELYVARVLRSKLGAKVYRDQRSGAGDVHKTDIRDYTGSLRWAMELKNQATIKLREWWRQASASTRGYQQPCLIIKLEQPGDRDEVLAVVRFDDLVNLEAEVKQLQERVDELQAPVARQVRGRATWPTSPSRAPADHLRIGNPIPSLPAATIDNVVQLAAQMMEDDCPNGHQLIDDYGHCLWKGCMYSRGYRARKSKS